MKIVYIITKCEVGGAQEHLLELIRSYHKDNDLVLISGQRGFLSEAVEAMGIEVHIVNTMKQPISPIFDILALSNVVRIIKKIKPDLIHAHSTKAGVIGRLAALILKIPVVFTAHGWSFTPGVPNTQRIISLMIEKLMGNVKQHVIAVSEYDRNLALYHKIVPENRLSIVHNGISDLPFNAEKSKEESSVVKLVMVGRFSNQKDQESLIKAVSKTENTKLTLVGDGDLLEKCTAVASNTLNEERYEFLGTRNDVNTILDQQDIFVLVTKYEGLPISIIEAMRAGLPVIASDVGGISELVVNGESGLLLNDNSISGISQKINYLVDNPDIRRRMGLNGRRIFESKFSNVTMIIRTKEIYLKSIAEHLTNNGLN